MKKLTNKIFGVFSDYAFTAKEKREMKAAIYAILQKEFGEGEEICANAALVENELQNKINHLEMHIERVALAYKEQQELLKKQELELNKTNFELDNVKLDLEIASLKNKMLVPYQTEMEYLYEKTSIKDIPTIIEIVNNAKRPLYRRIFGVKYSNHESERSGENTNGKV